MRERKEEKREEERWGERDGRSNGKGEISREEGKEEKVNLQPLWGRCNSWEVRTQFHNSPAA